MATIDPGLRNLSTHELRRVVNRCEARLFAGTSSHQDVLLLIEGEAELRRREARTKEARQERGAVGGSGAQRVGGEPLEV